MARERDRGKERKREITFIPIMNMIFTFIDIKIGLLYELLQKVIKGVDTEHVAICF